MDRLQKFIDNSNNKYINDIIKFIKYIPKYIIKSYIKCNPISIMKLDLFINFIIRIMN